MALSSVFSTSNQYIKYQIELIQNSQSIANNTSNVTVKIWIWRTNSGYTSRGSGTITYSINGTTYTQALTSDDKITSTKTAFSTKTVTVSHNADGSKAVACSASISHEVFSADTNSYNFTLTTIPRASTPTIVGTVNIGSAIQINTNRASSSFTHTLTYKFGSASGTIATNVGSTYNWTIPASLANQIKSATSGVLTITCDTYSGSAKIGTKSITRTAYVPNTAAFKPTINSVTVSEGNTLNTLRVYIQGISKLTVTTAATGGYSDIDNIKTEIEGSFYTGTTITSNILKNSGAATVKVIVTDTRGRSVEKTLSYTSNAYQSPTINVFRVSRCLSDGTLDEDGAYVKVDIGTVISDINNNATALQLSYKEENATTYTTITDSNLNNSPPYEYSTSFVVSGITFSSDNLYNFKLVLSDTFSSVEKSASISTAKPIIDIKADGTGVAFFKVCKDSGVHFGRAIYDSEDVEIRNGLAVYQSPQIDPDITNEPLVLTETGGPTGDLWYIQTFFYESKSATSNRAQLAVPYNALNGIYYRYYFDGAWSAWTQA